MSVEKIYFFFLPIACLVVVIIRDADKARLCIGAWLQDTALAAALSSLTISLFLPNKMRLYIEILFHFRYDSECTERYGWMYMYYRRVDDPYRIPQWGFVAAPHHCACKITPKYIPDS